MNYPIWMLGVLAVALPLMVTAPVTPAAAHGGGLNAQGCHNNRKTGDYHCHRGSSASGSPLRAQRLSGGNVYFPNCTAARAAGAAPVRAGDPGYAAHLDRDNDGVGCE
jgi:hypothetical protein